MNGYFKKRHDINQSFLDAGEELGVQKMWDYIVQEGRKKDG